MQKPYYGQEIIGLATDETINSAFVDLVLERHGRIGPINYQPPAPTWYYSIDSNLTSGSINGGRSRSLTYCLYFSVEEKKVKKRNKENNYISFVEK